jgi:hypothetical protein
MLVAPHSLQKQPPTWCSAPYLLAKQSCGWAVSELDHLLFHILGRQGNTSEAKRSSVHLQWAGQAIKRSQSYYYHSQLFIPDHLAAQRGPHVQATSQSTSGAIGKPRQYLLQFLSNCMYQATKQCLPGTPGSCLEAGAPYPEACGHS